MHCGSSIKGVCFAARRESNGGLSQQTFLSNSLCSSSGMIKVHSGTFRIMPSSSHVSELDLPIQADDEEYQPCLQDGDLTTANWIVNHGLEMNLSLDSSWQFDSLLSFEMENNAPEKMKIEETIEQGQRSEKTIEQGQPGNITAPTSPESSDGGSHRSTNPIPRHMRPSHKRAELKRRDKIKSRLDDIKVQVPSIADKGKMSESAILSKAAAYTKHLIGESERFSMEAGKLRQEIETLSSEIHTFQEQLPAAGLIPSPEKLGKSPDTLDHFYNNYLTTSIKDNWKFYIFSFFMKSLFKSYKKEVSTDNAESFLTSVSDWTSEKLGLANLRHQTLENMRDITRETDIMNHPESLPEEALASVARQSSVASPLASSSDFFSALQPPTCQSQAPVSSAPTINMATAQQELVSPFSAPMIKSVAHPKVIAAASADGQIPNSSCLPSKPVRTTTKKNGLKSTETVSAGQERKLRSVAGKPEYQQRIIPVLAVHPSKNFVPLTSQSSVQQSILVPNQLASINQLAASVEETSLNSSHLTSVVAPSLAFMTHPSASNVACVINGSDYDFDITDIPLPELDENSLSFPQPSVSMSLPFTCNSFNTFIETCPVSSAQPSVSGMTLNPAPRLSNGFPAQPVASSADVSLNLTLGLPPSTSS